MTTLPSGVTLQQIAGGPNYYTINGFTYAANAGWDNPNFFAIGPWEDMLITSSDGARWKDVGWNTAWTLTDNSSLAVADASHINVVLNYNSPLVASAGAETVGFLTQDEPSTFADGVSTPLSTTPNSVQNGHFWYINDTWNFIEYGGLNPVSSSTQVLETEVTTPNGTQRHIDASSIDIYWFAGAHAANPVLSQGGLLDNLGHDMTQDQAARGSNYGDMITREIAFTNGAQPVFAFIEDGGPYTEDTSSADYITPPELNWAVWSSLIHGARGIEYFNHTFAGPAQSDDNLAQPFYQTIQPGQTISMYNQVKATDALVEQLAPVLNSPTALGYVSVNTPGFVDGKVDSLFSGIETMVKDDNGQFYIFADTRDSESQHNIAATFTLNDPNATSVTVVNENRTIAVVNESFSDTFANASTVHIYQVNDSGAPPPPPPSAPTIASFSPDINGVDNTNSVTLNGKAGASSTVTVYDGNNNVGTAPVDTNGNWTFTENVSNGVHTFTATDTNLSGISPASSPLSVTVNGPAPLVVNGGFETGNFTGWTMSGNVAQLSIGPQLFITNSAHSGQDAAGLGSVGSDGTISQNVTTVVGQSYTLDFWLANAAGGTDDFTAKIGGVTELHLVNAAAQPYTHYNYTFTATSTSTPLEFDFRQDPSHWLLDDVSVVQATGSASPPPPPAPPAAPVIASFSPDTAPVGDGHTTATSITLTGTGEAKSTVNVFDGTTSVGQASVNASGAWSLPDSGLTVGAHSFTATDTDANGTSAKSAVFAVTVDAPTAPPPSPGNLVTNGGFETGDFTGWTMSGNVAQLSIGPQVFITSSAHSGQDAAGLGSVGSDGTISQNLTTVAGQAYTFDFWLANVGGNPNDFTAKIGGVTEMKLVNQPVQGYTHYVFDFTATSATTPIEFDFRQDPSEWHLDGVSVMAGAAMSGLTVVGTKGNDTLTNPTGTTSDLLTGNGGIDTFVFHGAAFGNDKITDFVASGYHDIIQFDHTVFANFAAVKAHAAQVGANTVITVDALDSVTLLGVSLSQLKAADFHFV